MLTSDPSLLLVSGQMCYSTDLSLLSGVTQHLVEHVRRHRCYHIIFLVEHAIDRN